MPKATIDKHGNRYISGTRFKAAKRLYGKQTKLAKIDIATARRSIVQQQLGEALAYTIQIINQNHQLFRYDNSYTDWTLGKVNTMRNSASDALLPINYDMTAWLTKTVAQAFLQIHPKKKNSNDVDLDKVTGFLLENPKNVERVIAIVSAEMQHQPHWQQRKITFTGVDAYGTVLSPDERFDHINLAEYNGKSIAVGNWVLMLLQGALNVAFAAKRTNAILNKPNYFPRQLAYAKHRRRMCGII